MSPTLLRPPQAVRERRRSIDGIWALTLAGVFAVMGACWFFGFLPLDLSVVGGGMALYIGLHLCASLAIDRLRSLPMQLVAAQVLQAAGVVFLAWLWHACGGVGNPVFLLVFAIPVLSSGILLLRYQPYILATLSIGLVFALAVAESDDLRRFLFGLNVPAALLPTHIPVWFLVGPEPLPGFRLEPPYLALLLTLFALFVLSLARISESVSGTLVRLHGGLMASHDLLETERGLFQAILRADPQPSLVVDPDTGRVLHASQGFLRLMAVSPEDVGDKTLFDLVQLHDPEAVRAALTQSSADVPSCLYTIGGETRIAELRCHAVEYEGQRHVYVAFRDMTDLYYLSAVFDGIRDPLLVVDSGGRLLYTNLAGGELFLGVQFGMDMRPFLTAAQPDEVEWWIAEPSGERSMRVKVGGQPFEARLVSAPLPGDLPWATVVTLRSVVEEERLYRLATHDPLTDLFNRRLFNETLSRAVATADRGGRAALALLDMDKFKSINDDLGHQGGDAALKHFVSAVKRRLRLTDVFARLGGDEFAILFVESGAGDGRRMLERVSEDLATDVLGFEGKTRELAFSAGVAALRNGDTTESLTARADEALYVAKETGRGRCAVSPEDEALSESPLPEWPTGPLSSPAALGSPADERVTP